MRSWRGPGETNLLEYLEEAALQALLPLESPWLRAELPLDPVLLPLLRQELLRGDKTRGMSTFTPVKLDIPAELLEPTCLLSCRSHSSSEDTGLEEDRERGMETPSPGTPLTPFHRWLEVSSTMSGWEGPPGPVCPSLY